MGLHPAVAAVRLAVRRGVADLAPGQDLVVACSGGADSLALLSAAVFEARRPGHRIHGVTVDHALQPGSADRAEGVVGLMRERGATTVHAVPVAVGTDGGPEAAARTARYAALDRVAAELGADVVLLGHTLDDQAETVLLGIARGSGARSLAGMAAVAGRYRRPLLGVPRAETAAACRAEGLEPWEDPHNSDPAYTRVRVRRRVLPVLEQQLGPGVARSLARTAELLRQDADALDDLAHAAITQVRTDDGLCAVRLGELAPAVRRRVLRLAALEAGCPGSELFAVHVDAMETLVTGWRGQRGVDLPGHVVARRVQGTLRLSRRAVGG